jgi:integrase
LALYVGGRGVNSFGQADEPFFALRDGRRVSQSVARRIFASVRALAGVRRQEQCRYQPRLHDLRHTAAVHRLIAWYRNGEDLQILLPKLVTYLGHVNLAATQHYLTLTPDLLNEASARFERYAFGDNQGRQS